jgi:hypothetical protein
MAQQKRKIPPTECGDAKDKKAKPEPTARQGDGPVLVRFDLHGESSEDGKIPAFRVLSLRLFRRRSDWTAFDQRLWARNVCTFTVPFPGHDGLSLWCNELDNCMCVFHELGCWTVLDTPAAIKGAHELFGLGFGPNDVQTFDSNPNCRAFDELESALDADDAVDNNAA